jgi:hypothetical protein
MQNLLLSKKMMRNLCLLSKEYRKNIHSLVRRGKFARSAERSMLSLGMSAKNALLSSPRRKI